MARCPLSNLRVKLIKIGARFVRHVCSTAFHPTKVSVSGHLVGAILSAKHRLRARPPFV